MLVNLCSHRFTWVLIPSPSFSFSSSPPPYYYYYYITLMNLLKQ